MRHKAERWHTRVHQYVARHQAPLRPRQIVLAGLGGALAIGVVSLLSVQTGALLIMASFGASCVLLFTVADSPLSQPANVIGGHMVSCSTALVLRCVLPNELWAVSLAVGVAIAVTALLRVTHPPAGANPLIVFQADPGIEFLISPVLIGSLSLVAIASLYHRATGVTYPVRPR